MYSVWGLAADVAYTQQEKQHWNTEDTTCFFNGNENASRPNFGHDAILWAIHIIRRVSKMSSV